jgi:hypothetical protein
MRSIKIPECTYDAYSEIRDALMLHFPYAVANDQYSKELKTAVFLLNDSDYIPPILEKYKVVAQNYKQEMTNMIDWLKNWKPDLKIR